MQNAMHNTVHTSIWKCNILFSGGICMEFTIRSNKKESENKTIRFPLTLIDRINRTLQGTDVSFSSFVIQACEFALDHMKPDNQD